MIGPATSCAGATFSSNRVPSERARGRELPILLMGHFHLHG